MGLFDKAKEKWNDATSKWSERKKAKQETADAREQKVDDRRDYKLDKIEAQEEKAYAVAAKRKWLAILLIAAIAAYLIIFKGGFSFGGEWLDKIKGIF